MARKLFAMEDNEVTEFEEVQPDELLDNINDLKTTEDEVSEQMETLAVAEESIYRLQSMVEAAEIAIEERKVSKGMVLALSRELANVYDTTGHRHTSNIAIASEDINGDYEAILSSLVLESRGVITSVIAEITKAMSRIDNTVGKYVVKLNTVLTSLGNNLEKRREEVSALPDIEKGTVIERNVMFKLNAMGLMSIVLLSDSKNITEGLKKVIAPFKDPKAISNIWESLTTMATKDTEIKPIYTGIDDRKVLLEWDVKYSLAGNVFKKLVCKSDNKKDKLIVGFNGTNVSILTRCKVLGVESDLMPYHYSVHTLLVGDFWDKLLNNLKIVSPTKKEMLYLIDEGIELIRNRKKMVDDIHATISMGSETIKDLDENTTFVGVGIYGVLPDVLMALSSTYSEIPNAIHGLSKLYVDEAKKQSKEVTEKE